MAAPNKTQNIIAAALRDLLEQKPLEAISVSDIVAKSGLSRKTFYYHFDDKYSLVNWMFYQQCLAIKDEVLEQRPWDYIRAVAGLFEQERPVVQSMLQDMGQNSLGQYFSDLFYELYQNSLSDGFMTYLKNEDSVEIALTGLVEMTRMSFILWLSKPEGKTAGQLVGELRRIAEVFGVMTCYGASIDADEEPCGRCVAILGKDWSPIPDKDEIESVPPEREGQIRKRIRTEDGGYRRTGA